MKELSIEEKAHNYDEAIKRANSLLSDNQLGNAWIYKLLPELKESGDERVRNKLIEFFKGYSPDKEWWGNITQEDILAWLERQGGHAKFCDSIQVGDKVTRNQDGVLVNLSQLKRVAKPAEEYNIRGIGSKHAEGKLKELIEKQCEQNPADKIQLGKKYKCIASPRYTAFMKGSIYEPKDKFLCSLMNFCSDCFEPIEDGEQKPVEKVEPKFKVGDWVVYNRNDHDCSREILQVYDIRDGRYYFNDNIHFSWSIKECDEKSHLWTIQDAKDGDVLVCESGWTCIFKALDNHTNTFSSYCFMDSGKWFCNTGSECHTLNKAFIKAYNGEIHPATKEQRNTLFARMKEAGYEWDTKKKELKKIKQKHFCELNNLCACIKFPFKAKVKSSGKIVTIHDGQLSYDDKEWIKYQSDAKDGYKVYEPNNLLESVCETEQNSTWSEEDEDILKQCLYFFNGGKGGISDNRRDEILNWFKSLKERVQPQPKQEWSDEDKKTIHLACEFIRHHSSLIDSIGGIDCTTLIDRLKSLRPQSTWKPSDEQMKALADALSLAKNCGEEIAFDLRTLHEQLKKLMEK